MNISGTSMVAFGFAALLGVTGFAYLDARNQFNQTTDHMVSLQSERDRLKQQTKSLQSERDKLNKQIESLQQQISTSNRQTRDLQSQLNESRSATSAYQGQVENLSVCLEGFAEIMNQVNQGNRDGAIITFSSISGPCREAEKIIKQQNSSGSRQEKPATTVGSNL